MSSSPNASMRISCGLSFGVLAVACALLGTLVRWAILLRSRTLRETSSLWALLGLCSALRGILVRWAILLRSRTPRETSSLAASSSRFSALLGTPARACLSGTAPFPFSSKGWDVHVFVNERTLSLFILIALTLGRSSFRGYPLGLRGRGPRLGDLPLNDGKSFWMHLSCTSPSLTVRISR